MVLVHVVNLRVHISNLLVDIRLNLMELVFCSSTAADIRTIFIPGLVVQVGAILASLVSAFSGIAILIIDGQAAVTLCNLANLDALVTTGDNLALQAIDSDLVVAVAGRDFCIITIDGNLLGLVIAQRDVVV